MLFSGPAAGGRIALTVDDGTCADCVSGYVEFARRTGTPLTFSPNGVYAAEWEPHATVLRALIETGQVQVMNHTFIHRRLTTLPDAAVTGELERNEAWIQRMFVPPRRPRPRPRPARRTGDHRRRRAAGELSALPTSGDAVRGDHLAVVVGPELLLLAGPTCGVGRAMEDAPVLVLGGHGRQGRPTATCSSSPGAQPELPGLPRCPAWPSTTSSTGTTASTACGRTWSGDGATGDPEAARRPARRRRPAARGPAPG